MSKNYGGIMGDMLSGHCQAHNESLKLQVSSLSKSIRIHPKLSLQGTEQLLVLPPPQKFCPPPEIFS